MDETWAKTNMTRTYGRSEIGTRLLQKTPHGRWETTTFIGALRSTGFVAPLTIDGPINGPLFLAWIEQHLAPVLNEGDVVVMDNLGSHKSQAVRRAIRAAGAHLLFLPPYSPELNPSEQAFAKLKHWMRKTAARSRETLWRAVGDILNRFTPEECANYLKNAGYASVKT